ncbi:hypothetical protein [Mycobacterium colombiense]|uniref:hypothetical protein n=1 Tax=Mycobacterium colombiense TaxID=339268 RepID=UPI001401ED9B|nr:hypothetical protein [Mycobacterium colombiense]
MRQTVCVAAAAVAVVTAACGGSPYVGLSTLTSGPHATTVTSLVSPASAADAYLRGLVPTPATTNRIDGPDPIHDGGIRLHFWVNGSPTDVLSSYKTALLDGHWTLIVDSSSGGRTTYTARNGNTFGVFTAGGFGGTTDIDACAWPSAPAEQDCARRG